MLEEEAKKSASTSTNSVSDTSNTSNKELLKPSVKSSIVENHGTEIQQHARDDEFASDDLFVDELKKELGMTKTTEEPTNSSSSSIPIPATAKDSWEDELKAELGSLDDASAVSEEWEEQMKKELEAELNN